MINASRQYPEILSPDEGVVSCFRGVNGRNMKVAFVHDDNFTVLGGSLGHGGMVGEPAHAGAELETERFPSHAWAVFRGVQVQQAQGVIGDELQAAIVGGTHVHGSDTAAVGAELLDASQAEEGEVR